MSEALGKSQVLEYLKDLSDENEIFLLSFERYISINDLDEINRIAKSFNINWIYLKYSNKYGIVSTLIQIISAVRVSSKIIKLNNIGIVHARSFIPCIMGILLKKKYGFKIIYDIRAFLIDEKVDSKRIKRNSLAYFLLNKIENYLYCYSDHIVSLTHAAKEIILSKYGFSQNKVSVIPTCANKKIFKLLSEDEKDKFRLLLGLNINDKILIHTGTVINRYDFEKEVLVFKNLLKKNKQFKFLVVNRGQHIYIEEIFLKNNIRKDNYIITVSNFEDVYKYLNISDFSIFFIPPNYAKKAMSPTRFAENIACHLPTITNKGVGDMERFFLEYDVGCIIDYDKIEQETDYITDYIIEKISGDNKSIGDTPYNDLFHNNFSKCIAVKKYQSIYDQLTKLNKNNV